MIALTLWACALTDEPQPSPFEPTPMPSAVPWVLPATGETAPLDLDAVLDAASDGIVRMATLDPDPVLDAYRDLAAGADPNCPALYQDDEVEYWLDTCTSGDGTLFDGFGIDDQILVDDGYDGYALSATGGTGRIQDGDGTWLSYDGYAQRVDDEQDGVTVSTLQLSGTFATNHPAGDGTWVGDGLTPNVAITSYAIAGARVAFAITGSISGMAGDFPAVAFNDAAVVDPSVGYGGCDLEPSGVVSVRLLSGAWVDIVFDPEFVDDGGVVVDDPAACDGCGQAWSRDESLGEVCLDFSSWLSPSD